MPQSKILVDTNTYLRLAKTIRPLLSQPFGVQEYCLYILPELNRELSGRRLQTKFPWVDEDEYRQNRQYFPKLSRHQKKSIEQSREFLWDYVQSDLPGPSRIDVLYVATALELNLPLVTDDLDMRALSKVFGGEVICSLELLKLMLDCKHVSHKTVETLVEYWKYMGDKPANFARDYKRHFGKK